MPVLLKATFTDTVEGALEFPSEVLNDTVTVDSEF